MERTASPEKSQISQRTSSCSSFSGPSGGFDCNICLDNATDPVVTLCGHLFCWPCIYKWIKPNNHKNCFCPVCKTSISRSSLVPIYAGSSLRKLENIPQRPSPNPGALSPRYIQTGFLGGNAVALLPWVLGEHWMGLQYNNPYQHLYCSDPRLRRQETRAKCHLHRLSGFLFFCLVLCLLLF